MTFTYEIEDLLISTNSQETLRRNQFNLLVYGLDSMKISYYRENKLFSSQFLELTIWKEKIIFLSKQRRKTSSCFSTVYLFLL